MRQNKNFLFKTKIHSKISSTKIGFIVLRHVTNKLSNYYWINCCNCIKKYYTYPIIIIDDNSDYNYVKVPNYLKTIKVIDSEYKARGELLPYYYMLNYKLFDVAIIIHDSVFFNKYVKLNTYTNTDSYHFIWNFKHNPLQLCNKDIEIENMIELFNDAKLLEFYKSNNWSGCFGCMTVINYTFLKHVNSKYNINILLPEITNRFKRMLFERVLAILFQSIVNDKRNKSILGNIHHYCKWGIQFKEKNKYNYLPIIKVWTGR